MSNLIVILFGLFCLFLMYDFNKNLEKNNVKYNMTRGAYFVCLIPPIFVLAIVALCGERQVRLESIFASLLSTFTSLSRTEFFHRLDVLMNIATNCMLVALAAAAIWTIYVSYLRVRKLKLNTAMTLVALIGLIAIPYIVIPALLLYSNANDKKIEEPTNSDTVNSVKNSIADSANKFTNALTNSKKATMFTKLFPASDQQYKAFYAYIVISFFGALVSAYYGVYKGQEWFSSLFDMCTFIVSIYLLYCAGVIGILVKSFIGFMVSLFLIAIFPPIIVALIPISIYYNRKKFEYLKKYSYYIWKFPLYLIAVFAISFVFSSIIFKGDMIILATGAFTSVGTVLAMWLFMYQEQKKNIPFLTFYRNMWMVPTVFFLLLLSFVTAHHSFDVVSDLEGLEALDSSTLNDNLSNHESGNTAETGTTFPSLLHGLKVDSDTMAAILGQEGIEISSQYNGSTTINQSGQIISDGISTGSHISVDVDGTKNVVTTQSGETIKVDSLNIIHGGPLDGATVFHNPDGTFYVSHNGVRSEIFNNDTTSLIKKSIT